MAHNRANRAEKELEKIFGEFNVEQLLVDLYFYFDCLSKRKTYYLNCVIFLAKRLKKLSDFTTSALYEKCFFWFAFCSVRIQGNTDWKKLGNWTLFTQWGWLGLCKYLAQTLKLHASMLHASNWRCSCVFIGNFKRIWHLILVFLLLTLNR